MGIADRLSRAAQVRWTVAKKNAALWVDDKRMPHVREALLVTGFWRSGTTWIQQAVARSWHAKTVFEPFSPENTRQHREASGQLRMPLHLDPTSRDLYENSMRGFGRGRFTLYARDRTRDAFRTRVVTKYVRLGFALDDLLAERPLPAIHLRRHPAAVVNSFRNASWHWGPADARLTDAYPEDLPVAQFLREHDTNDLTRIGALWAASEAAVQRAVDAGRTTLLSYEHATRDGHQVDAALAAVGIRCAPVDLAFDSRTTSAATRGQSSAVRADAWRTSLPADDLERLERITVAGFPAAAELWR